MGPYGTSSAGDGINNAIAVFVCFAALCIALRPLFKVRTSFICLLSIVLTWSFLNPSNLGLAVIHLAGMAIAFVMGFKINPRLFMTSLNQSPQLADDHAYFHRVMERLGSDEGFAEYMLRGRSAHREMQLSTIFMYRYSVWLALTAAASNMFLYWVVFFGRVPFGPAILFLFTALTMFPVGFVFKRWRAERIIGRERPVERGERPPHVHQGPARPSFGLMRLCGMACFLGVSILTFHLLSNRFGLDASAFGTRELGGRGSVLLVVSVAIGLIGLLIGQAIGFRVPIRSEAAAKLIDVAWHFAANGTVLWLIASTVVIPLSIGPEGAKSHLDSIGVARFSATLMAFAIAVSWLVALEAGLLGGFALRSGSSIVRFLAWAIPMASCAAGGFLQATLLGTPQPWGAVACALIPVMLLPQTASTLRKDQLRRAAMASESG